MRQNTCVPPFFWNPILKWWIRQFMSIFIRQNTGEPHQFYIYNFKSTIYDEFKKYALVM